jgi:signal transduction histidine kinase/CheY-like chemotaxis protein
MRVRTRLLLLVLSVLVPAFIAAALGIGYVFLDAQESIRKNLRETTRALALLVDYDIEKREGILQSLAESPALDQDDLETFYRHAKKTASNRNATIVLADANGRPLLNTEVPLGTKNIANSGTLLKLRKEYAPEQTIVSNLYFSPHRKTQSFSIQVPVKRNDRILYYLSIGTNVSQFRPLLANQGLPENWIGAIVDRNGTIIARTHAPEKYIGQQIRDRLFKRIQESQEGFQEGFTLDGMHTMASFSLAPKSEWTFIVNVPYSELQRTAFRATIFMTSISLLLLGFALVAAFAVARRTVRPIEALRVSAERLGQGKEVEVEHSGIREMDEVQVAMAKACADIRDGKAELERRVEEAVAAAERSQRALLQAQKLESLGRLTGGIAHDFNNVLQALTSGLQLAHLSTTDARVRALMETCQRAVDRAAKLTRQLMAFGRVQDAQLETVDMARQLREVMPLLKGSLPSHIDFRVVIANGLWPVTLDRIQLELALLNLTINARDAMPQGGVLEIEVRNESIGESAGELEKGNYVRITVADSGEGMSHEVLDKAVDPFFTTKGAGQGSGLGLPQAYGFARQTGGTLLLRSQPAKGTSAILYLPASDHPAVPSEAPANRTPPQKASGGVLLFVEDDPLVKDAVQPALEAAGFQIRAARDGEEAIRFLESGEHIDFVFSDIVMPGSVNGIDLAELVQKRYPHIRVLLASGYSDRRVSLPNVRALSKPYDVAEVITALTDNRTLN